MMPQKNNLLLFGSKVNMIYFSYVHRRFNVFSTVSMIDSQNNMKMKHLYCETKVAFSTC